jgi:hypothetical protein
MSHNTLTRRRHLLNRLLTTQKLLRTVDLPEAILRLTTHVGQYSWNSSCG